MKNLYSALKKEWLFILLSLVFIATGLSRLSFVPVWDGWAYLHYYKTPIKGIYFGHSAFLHTLLFGLTQVFNSGNYQLACLLNILLGLLGLVCFRMLLAYLFDNSLSRNARSLITFCFGLNPIFLAQLIQPGLDYSLAVFLSVFLILLFKRRGFLAALSGMMLVFTKEAGFMLYCLSVFWYFLLYFPDSGQTRREFIRNLCILLVPIFLFMLFMFFFPPFILMGSSWYDGILNMFSASLFNNFFIAQLATLCLINFNWVIMFLIIAGFLIKILRFQERKKFAPGFQRSRDKYYFYILTILSAILLTRIKWGNNPRYIVPILPLFIILFAESLTAVLKGRRLVVSVLCLILSLLYASSFRTIDPVSKLIFGTFEFGSHKILKMSRFTDPNPYYQGRDELVYNFEFTQIPLLTEKIIAKIGLDKIYISDSALTPTFDFPNYDGFRLFDVTTGRRTDRERNAKKITLLRPEEVLTGNYRETYFIKYPNMPNVVALEELSKVFETKENIVVENQGYAIEVLRLVRRQFNAEGGS